MSANGRRPNARRAPARTGASAQRRIVVAAAGLFIERPTVLPGRAERSDLPGIGVVIDRDEARKYRATAAERPHLRTADGAFTNG
ncbi:hypothetical protein [Streptomyces sp. NBC_00057]|uniref:hypothetical protein n=1 Tax=Streptomyces sp. NBC_00057 TaxID=2975634 RepID=UPI00325084D5